MALAVSQIPPASSSSSYAKICLNTATSRMIVVVVLQATQKQAAAHNLHAKSHSGRIYKTWWTLRHMNEEGSERNVVFVWISLIICAFCHARRKADIFQNVLVRSYVLRCIISTAQPFYCLPSEHFCPYALFVYNIKSSCTCSVPSSTTKWWRSFCCSSPECRIYLNSQAMFSVSRWMRAALSLLIPCFGLLCCDSFSQYDLKHFSYVEIWMLLLPSNPFIPTSTGEYGGSCWNAGMRESGNLHQKLCQVRRHAQPIDESFMGRKMFHTSRL